MYLILFRHGDFRANTYTYYLESTLCSYVLLWRTHSNKCKFLALKLCLQREGSRRLSNLSCPDACTTKDENVIICRLTKWCTWSSFGWFCAFCGIRFYTEVHARWLIPFHSIDEMSKRHMLEPSLEKKNHSDMKSFHEFLLSPNFLRGGVLYKWCHPFIEILTPPSPLSPILPNRLEE